MYATADCEGQREYEKLLSLLALRRYSFTVAVHWASSEMRVATVRVDDWREE